MPDDPWYIQMLDKLGVNTTKLKWRLYQNEQRAKNVVNIGNRPGAFHWLKYKHKTCASCGALNDHDDRTCSKCGAKLPGMFMQRLNRAFGAAGISGGGPQLSRMVMGLIFLVYAFQVGFSGFSIGALFSPDGRGFIILGSLDYAHGVVLGEYWRFLAFGLIHGGALHIGMNMYVLMQLMPLVESHVERGRLLVMVTLWQLISGFVVIGWDQFTGGPDIQVVGASGWLFGAMGYGIVWAHRNGYMDIRNSLLRWTGIVLVLGLIISRGGGGISNTAHMGGLIAGLITANLPEPKMRPGSPSQKVWNVAFLVCLVLWIATLIFMAMSAYDHRDVISDMMRR